MRYQLSAYIKFLYKSKNQHGIHSPFVFKLITKCFYDRKFYSDYNALRSHRKELLNTHHRITVKDFGKGSRVFKSKERKISSIARIAGISFKRQQLLYRLTAYLQPQTSMELGTSLGMATMAMALGMKNGEIITLEGCGETNKIAKEKFKAFSVKNVSAIHNNFDEYLNSHALPNKIDFAFIDGHHQKDATLRYFNLLLDRIDNDSCIIFDDIYWSKEMTEAWNLIRNNPKVSVSIDTFKWGIVFFRKQQPKQHFVIRV